jgi:hypothetical protein
MNFNSQTVTWDIETFTMKVRSILSLVAALNEVYMSAMEPQTLRDKYSIDTKILNLECKPVSLDNVIKHVRTSM